MGIFTVPDISLKSYSVASKPTVGPENTKERILKPYRKQSYLENKRNIETTKLGNKKNLLVPSF